MTTITVNVHHPIVQRVQRFEGCNDLLITFGDEKWRDNVAFFVSEAEWSQIIADVGLLAPDASIIPMGNA